MKTLKNGKSLGGSLPSGSFTVDRTGSLIASTVSSRFPVKILQEISKIILHSFSSAQKAGLPLAEFNLNYGAIKIRAIEMRGGAMIFLSPRGENRNRVQTTP